MAQTLARILAVRVDLLEKTDDAADGMLGTRRMKDLEGVLCTGQLGMQNGLKTLLAERRNEANGLFREDQTIVTALEHEERRSVRMDAGNR